MPFRVGTNQKIGKRPFPLATRSPIAAMSLPRTEGCLERQVLSFKIKPGKGKQKLLLCQLCGAELSPDDRGQHQISLRGATFQRVKRPMAK